jgi:predicted transcriptional regulator
MESISKILTIFKNHNIGANQSLSKRMFMDEVKSLGIEVVEIRNAWHTLIGNGLIIQQGEQIILTEKGNQLLSSL